MIPHPDRPALPGCPCRFHRQLRSVQRQLDKGIERVRSWGPGFDQARRLLEDARAVLR